MLVNVIKQCWLVAFSIFKISDMIGEVSGRNIDLKKDSLNFRSLKSGLVYLLSRDYKGNTVSKGHGKV